jgi:hypothetical protein
VTSEKLRIGRREFVKLGCAGLVSLSSVTREYALLSNSVLGTASAPENPVLLKSPQLQVTLDRERGLPYLYKSVRSKAEMSGCVLDENIVAVVCHVPAWEFESITAVPTSIRITDTEAIFDFSLSWASRHVTDFTVQYMLSGASMFITLENVQEATDLELIQVELPQLATVKGEQSGAWLAHGEEGGSVVSLDQAKIGHLPADRFWGDILATLPVVMIGNNQAACIQETTAYMDGTVLAVWALESAKRATIGTTQRYRVNGSLTYDMNADGKNARIAGKPGTPNLLVGQKPSCRVDCLFASESENELNWLVCVKHLRRRMPAIPNRFYHDKFQHDVLCDLPRPQAAVCTFSQVQDRLSQIAALTDNAPQIARIWGWQYHGKDTGYPAVDKVNERLGTYEELIQLKQTVKACNAIIALSDNYDDAYKSSPEWNPAFVAKRPDQELWVSRNWTGEISYVLGLAKYMEGAGAKRARLTCERYHIDTVAHIDVLTYYSIRDDWDATKPASGVKNLVRGRYRVLDIFKEYGVDVSSELIRYAFIGKVSSYHYGVAGGSCPFGGDPIPLQAALYRKSAIWGQGSDPEEIAHNVASEVFYNGHGYLSFSEDPPFNVPVDRMAELYYLSHLPWRELHDLNLETFEHRGDVTVMGFENGAVAELDLKTNEYVIRVNNREIARSGSTFCPIDDERIAFYSVKDCRLSARVPESWDEEKVAAIALAVYAGDRGEIAVQCNNHIATLHVPARQPVILYRYGAEAKARLLETESLS